MTITEAVALVLQAAALPGARGQICMLDMGRPVRIVDLAKKMIALAGPKRLRDARIVYTGLRPGEKLMEELVSASETSLPTTVSKIRIVQSPEEEGEAVEQMLASLIRAHGASDADLLLQELATVVPDYHRSTAAVPPVRPKQHEMEDRAFAVPTASA
jgi:FlaA1/EpsC-like NDP-sugar epimerase